MVCCMTLAAVSAYLKKKGWHKTISYLKSFFRLGACAALALYNIKLAALLFAFGEILGIVEKW